MGNKMNELPKWMQGLEQEDYTFIHRFIMASGSLKKIAEDYHVTYPTVRLRLDRLIERIKQSTDGEEDTYVVTIKDLALRGKMDYNTAKVLIEAYREKIGENKQ